MRARRKSRVCLIFFGLPRCTKKTIESITRRLIEPLEKYELTIVSCLNYQREIKNERSQEYAILPDENYAFFRKHTHLLLDPDEYFDSSLYFRLMSIGDVWRDDGASLKNHLLQLFTIKSAFDLALAQGEYDFFVFARPDLYIHDEIPIRKFAEKYQNTKSVLVPSWQWWDGVNDRFCMATNESARSFACRYENIHGFWSDQGKAISSEKLLQSSLRLANVNIKTCNARMSRVRVDGVLRDETFDIRRGFNSWDSAFLARSANIDFQMAFRDSLGLVHLRAKRSIEKIGAKAKDVFGG